MHNHDVQYRDEFQKFFDDPFLVLSLMKATKPVELLAWDVAYKAIRDYNASSGLKKILPLPIRLI